MARLATGTAYLSNPLPAPQTSTTRSSPGPCNRGSGTEFQFDCDVPNVAAGWYYTGVIIDPGNDVPETDVTNNSGSDVNPRLVQ
jgi:hypothetical protein